MIVRTSLSIEQVAAIQVHGHGPRKIGEDVVPVKTGICEASGASRTHATRLEVLLVGNGRYSDGLCQYGACRPRGGFSATHDEYGDWCAALFALDANAVAGPYRGIHDFNEATRYRYPTTPEDRGVSPHER